MKGPLSVELDMPASTERMIQLKIKKIGNKLLIIAIFFISSFSKFDINDQLSKNISKVDKIRIEFVNDEIMTPINVECEKFREYFGVNITTKWVTNKKEVNLICKEFSSFLKRGKKHNAPPDVRMRISFFSNNHVVGVVCSSRLLTSEDNSYFINDEKIKLFLQKLIAKE